MWRGWLVPTLCVSLGTHMRCETLSSAWSKNQFRNENLRQNEIAALIFRRSQQLRRNRQGAAQAAEKGAQLGQFGF